MGQKKTRVVLDTNILISGFGWKGNPRQILNKVVDKEIELIISFRQFSELSRVLNYSKLKFSKRQKTKFKNLILEISTLVKPTEKINKIKEDPDDNKILGGAVCGDADFIVSGDRHLLDLGNFKDIKIVTAKQFLEQINKF